MDAKQVGAQIAHLRKQKGLTQNDLGNELPQFVRTAQIGAVHVQNETLTDFSFEGEHT